MAVWLLNVLSRAFTCPPTPSHTHVCAWDSNLLLVFSAQHGPLVRKVIRVFTGLCYARVCARCRVACKRGRCGWYVTGRGFPGGLKRSVSYDIRNGWWLLSLLTYEAKIEPSVAILLSMYALLLLFCHCVWKRDAFSRPFSPGAYFLKPPIFIIPRLD